MQLFNSAAFSASPREILFQEVMSHGFFLFHGRPFGRLSAILRKKVSWWTLFPRRATSSGNSLQTIFLLL
jgi:hypothetical protein